MRPISKFLAFATTEALRKLLNHILEQHETIGPSGVRALALAAGIHVVAIVLGIILYGLLWAPK